MELMIRRPERELTLFGDTFRDVFDWPVLPAVWSRTPSEETFWAPAIELFEKDDRYVVRAELPGMKQEDIDVSVVGDTLTIKGERKTDSEVKEEDYYCREHAYGTFSRSIELPTTVDDKKIEAHYENGILEVGLPKNPEAKPKKIRVSARKEIK